MTPGHADILDQRESLRTPFTGALALHVGIAGALVLYAFMLGHRETFGDPNAGGAAVGITVTKSIPAAAHRPGESGGTRYPVASAAGAR